MVPTTRLLARALVLWLAALGAAVIADRAHSERASEVDRAPPRIERGHDGVAGTVGVALASDLERDLLDEEEASAIRPHGDDDPHLRCTQVAGPFALCSAVERRIANR